MKKITINEIKDKINSNDVSDELIEYTIHEDTRKGSKKVINDYLNKKRYERIQSLNSLNYISNSKRLEVEKIINKATYKSDFSNIDNNLQTLKIENNELAIKNRNYKIIYWCLGIALFLSIWLFNQPNNQETSNNGVNDNKTQIKDTKSQKSDNKTESLSENKNSINTQHNNSNNNQPKNNLENNKNKNEYNNSINSNEVKSKNKNEDTNLEVEACNIDGSRQANSIVDVGYGNREYYAYTNEYSQLVKVTASTIEIQHNNEENSKHRYCDDEAKVDGVQQKDLDEGHVIADSLGGVSNAYNITPQSSYLNRHGQQSQMEKQIRETLKSNGSAQNFKADITYDSTTTMIPSHYHIEVDLNNNHQVYDFDNTYDSSTNSTQNKTSVNKTNQSTSSSSNISVEHTNNNASSLPSNNEAHWGKDGKHCYMHGHRGAVSSSFCR